MIITQTTINLSSQLAPPIIQAVQGDTGRAVCFTLADYTIPEGADATYYIQKPSGEAVYNSATIAGNTITCELTAQSLAELGENNLQVRIIKGEDIVTSFDVILLVRPFRGIDAIESDTEMNIFDKAVEQAAEDFQSQAEQIVKEVIESIPSDYTALTEEVDELNERLNSYTVVTNIPETNWESGSLTAANGTPLNGSTRIRTKTYIDEEISAVAPISGYKMCLYAWSKADNTYVGVWNGTAFVQATGTANWTTTGWDLTQFNNQYNFKLILAKTDETTMTTANYIGLEATYPTDVTLSQAGKIADAKAVGDFKAEVETVINNNFTEKFTTLSGTKTYKKYLNSSGVVTDYNNTAYFVFDTEVTPGDKLEITSFAGYSAYRFAFYDENDTLISGRQSGSGGGSTETVNAVVPADAVKVVVAGNTISPTSGTVRKSEGLVSDAELFWSGKKWCVFGDSLTAVNSRTTKHYFDYIAENTGINVVNKGVSGTGYRNQAGESKAFYQVVGDVPTDSDVVTIFGSFNDGLTDLGTASDTGTSTVGGCMNTTLDNLYSVMPTVQLGIIAPTPWVGANPYNHAEANAYVELLEAVCKRRSIPFLNLYYESNLRPWDATFRSLAYTKDDGNGVHPDETGHALIAPRIEEFVAKLLFS